MRKDRRDYKSSRKSRQWDDPLPEKDMNERWLKKSVVSDMIGKARRAAVDSP